MEILLLLGIPFFESLKKTFIKMGLGSKEKGIDPYSLLLLVHFLGVIIVAIFAIFVQAPWSVIVPPDALSQEFIMALLIKAPLHLIALVSMLYALRHGLSFSVPILLLTPILVPFFGIFILDTSTMPTALGWIGIIIIVIGAYLLNADVIKQGPLEPIKKLFHHKASSLMLITAVLWSITSNYDKIGSVAASPLSWVFYTNIVLIILIVCIGILTFVMPQLRTIVHFTPRKSLRHIKLYGLVPLLLLAGITEAIMETMQMYAVTVIAVIAYVIVAKRLSVMLEVFIGGIFFKEQNWQKNILPTIIMLVGVFIILFQR